MLFLSINQILIELTKPHLSASSSSKRSSSVFFSGSPRLHCWPLWRGCWSPPRCLRSSLTCLCSSPDNITGQATCTDNCAALCPQPTTEEQECRDHAHRERKPEHKVSLLIGLSRNLNWISVYLLLCYLFVLILTADWQVWRDFSPFFEQYQQFGPEHHPDHHACWYEADRWEQTSQLCHSPTVPAVTAARTGHTGEIFVFFIWFTPRSSLSFVASLS